MDRFEKLLRKCSGEKEDDDFAPLPENLEELFDRFPETFKIQMNLNRDWADYVGLKIW